MQIVATFNDFEEMLDFAAKLQSEKKGEQTPVGSEVPVQNAPVQTPPVQTPPVQTPPVQTPPVQTTAPTYTLDDLSRAAMVLMDRGMQGQLQALLAEYGVASLPELPKAQYGPFATALRGMGAQI